MSLMKKTNKKKRKNKAVKFEVITVLPEALASYFDFSIMGRAQVKGLISVRWHDLRKYGEGKRQTVDDSPFGGGPGMVIKFEPVAKAIGAILSAKRQKTNNKQIQIPKYDRKKTRVVLFSTRGKVFNGKEAKRLAKYERLVLVCGRYEGVDERVKKIADEEMTVGNFVLAGGELAAAAVIESVARFVPGVLGKEGSLEERKGSYPVYTRPAEVKVDGKRLKVPEALMSGNHKEIEKWRRERGRGKEGE